MKFEYIAASIIIFYFLIIDIYGIYDEKIEKPYQEWKSINYDVTINEDGSMNVIETWTIKANKTNTLFKNFVIDEEKYGDITNVKVSEIIENKEISYKQLYEEQYHVKKKCFYALPIRETCFEIAWNIGFDDSRGTKTYKIYYTVNDVVKQYNDCAEIYWQFLGTFNKISGNNVTGTIKLPTKVKDIEKLRVWAHGELNGNIEKTSNDLITFSVNFLPQGRMLEVRVLTEENIFNLKNKKDINKLESILEEEQKWANETNEANSNSNNIFITIVSIILSMFFIFILKNIIKAITFKVRDLNKIKYFREIPDEKFTPARAFYLCESPKDIGENMSKIFAGTILDLSIKGFIKFDTSDPEKLKIILKDHEPTPLADDEKIVYNILVSASNEKDYITTEEFFEYSKKHKSNIHKKLESIRKITETNEKQRGNFDQKKIKALTNWKTSKYTNRVIMFIMIIIFLVMISVAPIRVNLSVYTIMAIIFLGFLGLDITYSIIIKNVNILSEKGYLEAKKWRAFKRYMKDYSILKEKDAPDIVLWEKFLVYATTFGISKKVIKQLEIVYPEMFEENNPNYVYWNIVSASNNHKINYLSDFNNGLKSTYSIPDKTYSSSSSSGWSSGKGGGGGFSSGGGGRRRRWWLRRALKLETDQCK